MSLKDTGMDAVIELKNEFALDVFETLFRKERICPPLTLSNITNPANSSQKLSMTKLIPRLKSASLRQTTSAGVAHVFVDLVLEPSVGTLYINGALASDITLPVEVTAKISSGKLAVGPDLTATPGLALLAAFLPVKSVELALDMLNDSVFSATPTAVALKLVGTQKNLAVGLDLDLSGTVQQFNGDCPKTATTVANSNLNGADCDLSQFYTTYNTALLSAGDYADVAIILDEQVLGAKIKTVSIDQSGVLENTRLWLISAGPTKMTVGGQGCAYHSISCVGDWWDSGWQASAKFVVKSGKIVIDYVVDSANLTDTDSGWDTCVNAISELQKLGMDKGSKDLGISASIGKDSDALGKLTIYSIAHRQNDAVLYATSNLTPLENPLVWVPSSLVIAPPCDSSQAATGEFSIEHDSSSGGPLHVCSLPIENASAGAFQVTAPTTPLTLELGKSVTVKVKFTGQTGQNYSGDLRVMSNGGAATVKLQAYMAGAQVSIPTSLTVQGQGYGNLCTGEWSLTAYSDLTFVNTGQGALQICSLSISNDANKVFSAWLAPAKSSFLVSDSLPQIYKAGETANVRVSLTVPSTLVGTQVTATLKITTSLGVYSVSLDGKITHKTDLSSTGASGSTAKMVLCGKLLYDPPRVRRIVPEWFEKYAQWVHLPEGKWEGMLFFDVLLHEAPRDLKVELFGQDERLLARSHTPYSSKFLVFPYSADQQYTLALTPSSDEAGRSGRFVLGNWLYQVQGSLQAKAVIADYCLQRGHMFVCAPRALLVAAIADDGHVDLVAELPEWGHARAATTAGGRLLLARDGLQVLGIGLPGEPTVLGRVDLPQDVAGLYNPDPHVHHISRRLLQSGLLSELVYAFGDELHTLRIDSQGQGQVLAKDDLAGPAFRALAWNHTLYLFGPHTLQSFDIAEPFAPQRMGLLRLERDVTNAFVLGCTALLVHEGPAVTMVDISQPAKPQVIGEYAAHPELARLFPSAGPIYIDRKFVHSLDGSRRRVLVGTLKRRPLDQEKIAAHRAAQG